MQEESSLSTRIYEKGKLMITRFSAGNGRVAYQIDVGLGSTNVIEAEMIEIVEKLTSSLNESMEMQKQ